MRITPAPSFLPEGLYHAEFQLNFFTLPQIATSSWGGKRKLPLAFMEHGAIMAATILNTRRAAEMAVYVVRAFVQLRDTLAHHATLAKRLNELEHRVGGHDRAIGEIIAAIRQLTIPPEPPKRRRIGFVQD